MNWRKYLSPEEDEALGETEHWLASFDAKRKNMMAWIERPLEAAFHRIPESLKDVITQSLANSLDKMREGSGWLVQRETVHDKLRSRVGPFQSSGDLLHFPVKALDRVAWEYVETARTGLTIEGAAAGTSGVVGLVADIPILYCVLFKLIQEVSFCYGYPVKPPQEKAHILKVLDVGHDVRGLQRVQGMIQLFQMQELIREGVSAEALEAFEPRSGTHTQALVRNLRLARQLALDLIQRKLLQTLVLVGGIVGAASNYQLTNDVGLVAYHAYRRRFLFEIAMRRGGAN